MMWLRFLTYWWLNSTCSRFNFGRKSFTFSHFFICFRKQWSCLLLFVLKLNSIIQSTSPTLLNFIYAVFHISDLQEAGEEVPHHGSNGSWSWKVLETCELLLLTVFLFFVLQLAQSVIELNNQIQQKDKEIQSNEAKSVSIGTQYLYLFVYVIPDLSVWGRFTRSRWSRSGT